MKLIIQIPCFNEEQTLPVTLKALPRRVAGFRSVEWLIVDDGSSDRTAEVARAAGAHVVSHNKNKGLARAFMTGIDACLQRGADVIVNTDADNQYSAADIPRLVAPILEDRAEIVIGARPIDEIEHFSLVKKLLQRLGSLIVRLFSNTDIPDAPSGFRAIARDAAMRLNVFGDYTYTIETIIQAGQKNMHITFVPISVNSQMRQSRLIKSIPSYLIKSLQSIIRIFVVYSPFKFFITIGLVLLLIGSLPGFRFLYYYFSGEGSGHIQSLILASVLLGFGFQTILSAFLADLLGVNRKLAEEIKYNLKKQMFDKKGR